MNNKQYPRKGIHQYVAEYIRLLPNLTGKTILDIPCGDGRASYEFKKKGASVVALDLFPEFMSVDGIEAKYADLSEKLPIDDASIDYVICQEGIEHMPNQLNVLQEFNRILKKDGIMLITTPNYSHARARVSHLLFETDFYKRMPPTEIDSIWFANDQQAKLYFGHLFLLGVQHLQTLMTVSGFKINDRITTNISTTSLIIGVVLYPIFLSSSLLTYWIYRNKNQHISQRARQNILRDRVKLNISLKTLFCKHVFWIAKKQNNLDVVTDKLKAMQRG